ncbi:hypothetical protein [Sphingomonas antarctica]|uniref:hypothetical protein n=1 Tax=Sphingomonas antarctica TaxID=2040274 RepID=UPI0039E8301A
MTLVVALQCGLDGQVVAVTADSGGMGPRAVMVETLVIGGLAIAFLMQVYLLLREIRAGETFGIASRRRLTRAAVLMLSACAVDVLLPPLTLLLTDGRATHAMTFAVSGSDALLLLLSTTFFFMARLFEHAAAFETDSHEIV